LRESAPRRTGFTAAHGLRADSDDVFLKSQTTFEREGGSFSATLKTAGAQSITVAVTFTGLVLRKKGNQKITIDDTLNSALTATLTENIY
jgi:hypothetical protein